MAQGTLRACWRIAGLGDNGAGGIGGHPHVSSRRRADMRGQIVAGRRGVDLKGIRARRIAAEDFSLFDIF